MKKSTLWTLVSVLALGISATSCSKGGDNNGEGNKGPEQKGSKALAVNPNNPLRFSGADTSTKTLSVITDADSWDASAESWVTLDKNFTDNTIKVSVTANDGEERGCDLVVTAPDATTVKIRIVQDEAVTLPDALTKGSAYYVIALDDYAFNAISDKVTADHRVDDINNFIYPWEGTYVPNTSVTGKNFYGIADPTWQSWAVADKGWSGMAFNNKNFDITDIDETWYFHMAIRASAGVHQVSIGGPTEYVMYCGPKGGLYNKEAGKAVTHECSWGGQWLIIDEPVSNMFDAGWDAHAPSEAGENSVIVLSIGNPQGTVIEFDGVFFYKK